MLGSLAHLLFPRITVIVIVINVKIVIIIIIMIIIMIVITIIIIIIIIVIIIIIIIIKVIITLIRIIISLRPGNTGLMSSGESLISWREGSSLALVVNPSRDGLTIKKTSVEAP